MNVDKVLVSLGMGRYHFVGCVLFGLVIMYSNVSPVAFVFTASDLKYRCEVPECDPRDPAEQIYEPEWLRFTTPYRKDTEQPRKCRRYAVVRTGSANGTVCEAAGFDRTKVERCQDHWVFEDPENTIGKEFGIMCEENMWMLTTVGSIHNLGEFIGIPISGVIADKFGRKFTLIFCTVTSAAISIAQSFSVNYSMFLIMELLSSTLSSGIYPVTFVLAVELVLPKQRVLYCSILECFYPFGAMMVALIASQVKDWRYLLRLSNIPGLLFFSYLWLTEESMKWLQMQGKYERVIDALQRIADINKKTLPDLHLETQTETTNYNNDSSTIYFSNLKEVFCSSSIFWRTIKCSFMWMSITLVYYGLNINAINIAGNKYLNFMLVTLVEIPACFLNWILMEGLSRKMSLSCMFLLNGATCIMYILISDRLFLTRLLLFLVSKLAIAIAFNVVYMLTVEIFPTQLRTTMVSVCSMIGRIGSMLAPQTMLLGEYFGAYVVMLVFGVIAFVAAAVAITLPESKDIVLPDTLDEAERIGIDGFLSENVENITEN